MEYAVIMRMYFQSTAVFQTRDGSSFDCDAELVIPYVLSQENKWVLPCGSSLMDSYWPYGLNWKSVMIH